jgi:Sec7-like guanine-nucleotide exchange factor
VAALREFVRLRPLGREAQEIDRSLNRFAAMFSAQNADFPLSSETLYVLAFSTVMLNTDLHNAAVKQKMTRDQFVRNTKAATQEPSVQFLGQIFEEIRQQSLQIGHAANADFVMM